jgi:glyoxylase-like metal-dependent hydrolase (beta-lactamase superfamily II)
MSSPITPLIRETFPVGLLGCNCTILGDPISREAIVIDPGDDIPHILSVLAKHQLTVKHILITHAHFDHIASAQTLKQLTGAPVLYNQADIPLAAMVNDQPAWVGLHLPPADVRPPDHSPADNESLSVAGIDAKILLTPGHSQGSLCLYVPASSLLIAGDTLFAGGIGRTDFPFGNHSQLLDSIRTRLLPLPPDTLVIPGHGPSTTIATEAATNPFLL